MFLTGRDGLELGASDRHSHEGVHAMAGELRARVAVFAGIAFVILLALLHVLEPEVDPSWSVVSEYPPSLDPGNATPGGRLHELGALLGSALPPGAALVTWSVRRSEGWRGRRRWLVLATTLTWVAMIAFSASLAVLLPAHDGRLGPEVTIGWQNRAMIAAFALWPAAAVRLARRSHPRAA
jgi:MFS family permease